MSWLNTRVRKLETALTVGTLTGTGPAADTPAPTEQQWAEVPVGSLIHIGSNPPKVYRFLGEFDPVAYSFQGEEVDIPYGFLGPAAGGFFRGEFWVDTLPFLLAYNPAGSVSLVHLPRVYLMRTWCTLLVR